MKRLAALVAASFAVSACSGGGHPTPTVNGGTSTSPTEQQTPSGGAFTQADYTCPSSDAASSVARASAGAQSIARRPVAARTGAALARKAPLLAVTYDAAALAGQSRELATARESSAGATFVNEYDFTHANLVTRIVKPNGGSLSALESSLRALPGVRAVGATNVPRRALSVSGPYITNDPIFKGTGVGPLYQTAATEGQWDMHVTRLEDAFDYSQSGNGSGVVNAGALGSSSVKLAVIDSGEDPNHPELSSKIVYQKCFITNPNNGQSTSDFETDPDGHGTSVTGTAAADTGNDFGFAGDGGAVSVYAYRVFPTPDDNCLSDNSTDDQCLSISGDIVSAIEDAVKEKVNVINMSLGGGACATAGTDPDPAEGAAVADAIAAGIVVVAASGNSTGEGVEAPACDSGVIAAGATALSDGQANSTGNTSGSAADPREYVASYSNYGNPGAAAGSASAWGIVAPGGDPSSDTDQDGLHWVENIWTTTPFDSSFAGTCEPDENSTSSQIDCRLLIAGTSLASPHVAGAAALIIAANPAYQSATKMKQLLCSTADDIGSTIEGCGRLDVYRAMAVAVGDGTKPAGRPVP